MIILGINGHSARDPKKGNTHNSGAAIIINGNVVAAVDEERISRSKGDKDYPFRAIDAVLEISGIRINDIDHIALAQFSRQHYLSAMVSHYSQALKSKPGDSFKKYLRSSLIDLVLSAIGDMFRPRTVPDSFAHIPKQEVQHQHAHAASTYYTQPWPEKRTLVITLDGAGDGECATVWIGENGELTSKSTVSFMHSVGLLYSSFTYHLGFKALQHEGKIVGLASFDSGKVLLQRLLAHSQFGDWNTLFDAYLMQLSTCALRPGADTIYAELTDGLSHEQIAAGIQAYSEHIITRFIEEQVKIHDCNHLSLAGGVFANVKLNQRILALDGVENIYVYPNMGDGGLAAGAALAEHARLNPANALPQFIGNVYLGNRINKAQAQRALDKAGLNYSEPVNLAGQTARLLADGKVVAIADGGMENGPRALGNRTVMAACSDPEINKWLNKRFKRTEFMPFAPVILEERAAEYFPDWKPEHLAARFMTITYNGSGLAIKSIPAAIHVDGTARPQVITREDNPGYYDIIKAYADITGIPCVINTSFNMHEEPIVCSAEDAVRAFIDAKLDALVLGPFLIVR